MYNNQDPRQQRNGYSPLGEPQVKRTYTPEEAGHDKHRKPVSRFSRIGHRRRKRKRVHINTAVLTVFIVFSAVIFASLLYILVRDDGNGKGNPQKPDETVEITVESENEEEELSTYITLTLEKEDIHTGELILVNSYTEYVFPSEDESTIVNIADHKNDYYKLSSYTNSLSEITVDAFNVLTETYYNETGFASLQVNSAFRSREDQESIYADYTEKYGADYAKSYVADPGFSEHHTGLAMDLNVYMDGYIYYVGDYEGCEWFRENCEDYGFILRYPDDKVYRTGINYESWHYRYVGVPHAAVMEEKDLCLEEYLEDEIVKYSFDTLLLNYTPNGEIVEITADEFEEGYAIFYVKAEEETTEITIPKDCTYSVSGNNFDGFVVTLKK